MDVDVVSVVILVVDGVVGERAHIMYSTFDPPLHNQDNHRVICAQRLQHLMSIMLQKITRKS